LKFSPLNQIPEVEKEKEKSIEKSKIELKDALKQRMIPSE